MKYFLYCWPYPNESSHDLILEDRFQESGNQRFIKLGPFDSIEEAKGAWILLGRKSALLSNREERLGVTCSCEETYFEWL